jgi:hypothetical protein
VVISTANTLGPINVYEPHVEGDAPILRTFRSAATALAPRGIEIVDEEIIIASRDDIQVFDQDTDGAFLPGGAATPKRRIAGPASQISRISSLAVRGAEIFTANGRILVHAIEANGQSPPLRYIAGTGRDYQHVQVVGAELFAASASGHIDVYDAAASGEPTPLRTLDTGISDILELHATSTELFVTHLDNVLRVYSLER